MSIDSCLRPVLSTSLSRTRHFTRTPWWEDSQSTCSSKTDDHFDSVPAPVPLSCCPFAADHEVITSLLEQHGQGGACAEGDPWPGVNEEMRLKVRVRCEFPLVSIRSATCVCVCVKPCP